MVCLQNYVSDVSGTVRAKLYWEMKQVLYNYENISSYPSCLTEWENTRILVVSAHYVKSVCCVLNSWEIIYS